MAIEYALHIFKLAVILQLCFIFAFKSTSLKKSLGSLI